MRLSVLLLMPAMGLINEDCFESKDEGKVCGWFSTRFYYDSHTGSCEKFAYGGCEGNKNNFDTKEACERACTDVPAKECSLPVRSGECDESLTRYYFNAKSGRCERSIYGDCDGNFLTPELCNSKCIRPTPDKLKENCNLEPNPGPCMAEIIKFSYSPRTDSCHSFTYGGCGGNENNYETEEDCLSTCRSVKRIETTVY